jgi:hypothetical protein
MSVTRTFVKKNGRLKVKQVVERPKAKQLDANQLYQIYLDDLRLLFGETDPSCSKIREYIPGEFDGIPLPHHLDLSEITHTYVIIDAPDSHVEEHLEILSGTAKAIVSTVEEGMPPLARVPLLPEQAEIIRQDIQKGDK